MSVDELRVLLDQVGDTREIVLRRTDGWAPVRDAWSEARDEAVAAYLDWRTVSSREAYASYRAAQDREDAAQDALAMSTAHF
ncbi:MAG: hypothetical protein QOE28_2994 [Solirubrobacteraceae bacterium]|nr:hypothetical protein [Solirubrobacteraceae bacterium]